MVTQHARRRRLSGLTLGFLSAIGLISASSGCDKMPLLAPSGTVITVITPTTTVPLNSEVEIIVTVIENGTASAPPSTPTNPGTPTTPTTPTSTTGAGTPVHNGTVVSFTTTVGRIEPSEARTQNGQVRVKFITGAQSGKAVITAFSGGASGKSAELNVGAAAVARIVLSASPQVLPPTGGVSDVSARVEDTTGAGLSDIPVTFSADRGSLSPSIALTDSTGVARTRLTASATTIVTANAGAATAATLTINLNPRTGISITAPSTTVSAGLPASFTVNVASGAGAANVRDVTVDFGDGTSQSLGAISSSTSIQHTYNVAGTYQVRATATEASGFTETVSTSVTILPAQPPGVVITASDPTPNINQIFTLTVTVTGATSTIQRFEWDFGDGTTAITTGPQITKAYPTAGTKVIRVRVIQTVGPAGEGQTTVDVQP